MKIFIALFSILLLSSCSLKSSSKTIPTPTMNSQTSITATPSSVKTRNTDTVVALKTQNGQVVIKLYQTEAPNTVANFLKKVNNGFYNGLTFHRVEPGFVIQGGDPLGNGTGGGNITSEINQIPFRRGSVGLARGGVKSISNDSQFYICLSDASCSGLTGDYVNFGEVISGMDIVDQVKIGDKIIEITTKTK